MLQKAKLIHGARDKDVATSNDRGARVEPRNLGDDEHTYAISCLGVALHEYIQLLNLTKLYVN